MDLTEAIQMLAQNGFDINGTNPNEDDLDQIPYYENERFGAWAAKEEIDIFINILKKNIESMRKRRV